MSSENIDVVVVELPERETPPTCWLKTGSIVVMAYDWKHRGSREQTDAGEEEKLGTLMWFS